MGHRHRVGNDVMTALSDTNVPIILIVVVFVLLLSSSAVLQFYARVHFTLPFSFHLQTRAVVSLFIHSFILVTVVSRLLLITQGVRRQGCKMLAVKCWPLSRTLHVTRSLSSIEFCDYAKTTIYCYRARLHESH